MRFLRLDFLPHSVDVALLLLRLWFGLSLLVLHGWGKLTHFSATAAKFPDLFGIGATATTALAILGEVVFAGLLALGLFTRLAALGSAVTMAVAFTMAHGAKLIGPASGEMAFLYLGAFVTLFVAGGGRYSVDRA